MMTATNPNLIELQRKVKDATKNVTAAKKAVIVAKNAIGDYLKERLDICVDKGILVHTIEGWEPRNDRFYLRVDNNKVFVHYRSEYTWTFKADPIDKYMSQLEDDIRDYSDLYEETGEDYYEESINVKKDKYETLKSIVDILYN
jgi:uncharacterized protein YeeX (DUF496 family)